MHAARRKYVEHFIYTKEFLNSGVVNIPTGIWPLAMQYKLHRLSTLFHLAYISGMDFITK